MGVIFREREIPVAELLVVLGVMESTTNDAKSCN